MIYKSRNSATAENQLDKKYKYKILYSASCVFELVNWHSNIEVEHNKILIFNPVYAEWVTIK